MQGRGVLRKGFSSFPPCSRRSSLCEDGELGDDGHGVIFLSMLERLRRYLFVYLSSKILISCFNAFCRTLYVLCVSMLISFIFSYLENVFRGVFLIVLFLSQSRAERA